MNKSLLVAVVSLSLVPLPSLLAQDAQPAAAAAAPVYPAGPGGRDTPLPPAPRPDPLPPFYDPKLSVAKRVEDVVSRLTLEEKVALMQMASPSIPRLGIAPYHWWTEALHGMTHDLSTVFPQAIGLSATWDTDLHFKVATAISTEGRAKNFEYRANNVYNSMTGLDFWSPNVNIFRDPRWGRGQETYGEDPYLSGRFAIAFVKGIQGDRPGVLQGHCDAQALCRAQRARGDAPRSSTPWSPTRTSTRPTCRSLKRRFARASAHSVMSAYNALNGVPASGNKRLLTDILRTQWGFDGYVVGDDGSVGRHLRNPPLRCPTAFETSAAGRQGRQRPRQRHDLRRRCRGRPQPRQRQPGPGGPAGPDHRKGSRCLAGPDHGSPHPPGRIRPARLRGQSLQQDHDQDVQHPGASRPGARRRPARRWCC